MKTYVTINGDTWDKIALKQYGSEYMLPILLQYNQTYRLVLVFESGVELVIPDVEEEDVSDKPPWLEDDDSDIEEIEDDSSEGDEDVDISELEDIYGSDLQ